MINEFTPHYFRTVIEPINFEFNISYQSGMVLIGSCFSENVGNILKDYKFNVDINPFGILYNPISTANCIDFLLSKRQFTEVDLVYNNEYMHSFYHHGKFSNPDKNIVLERINKRIVYPTVELSSSDFLFITFGSSWVYELKQTGEIVSNCHKFPNTLFNKKLIKIDDTVRLYSEIIQKLLDINPNIKIIFSVSPIRHLKEGFQNNFLSKSILRIIINDLVQEFKPVYYFPVYEILIDELRDYRFYNEDMVHPTGTAVNYMFEFFSSCFFNNETVEILKTVKKIIRAGNHIPFNTNTQSYKEFKCRILNQISELTSKYDFLNFRGEIEMFK